VPPAAVPNQNRCYILEFEVQRMGDRPDHTPETLWINQAGYEELRRDGRMPGDATNEEDESGEDEDHPHGTTASDRETLAINDRATSDQEDGEDKTTSRRAAQRGRSGAAQRR
jgi:hypothetical protein